MAVAVLMACFFVRSVSLCCGAGQVNGWSLFWSKFYRWKFAGTLSPRDQCAGNAAAIRRLSREGGILKEFCCDFLCHPKIVFLFFCTNFMPVRQRSGRGLSSLYCTAQVDTHIACKQLSGHVLKRLLACG